MVIVWEVTKELIFLQMLQLCFVVTFPAFFFYLNGIIVRYSALKNQFLNLPLFQISMKK